jgi:hypothetical protein
MLIVVSSPSEQALSTNKKKSDIKIGFIKSLLVLKSIKLWKELD